MHKNVESVLFEIENRPTDNRMFLLIVETNHLILLKPFIKNYSRINTLTALPVMAVFLSLSVHEIKFLNA